MHSFKDKAGKPWQVEITVGTNKVVKGLLGFSLYDLVDKGDQPLKPLAKFLEDPEQLVNLLYVLCKDQADQLSMTDEDFGRLFTGEVLGDATDAFVGELISFFPNPQVRQSLQKVVEKGREFGAKLVERMDRELANVDLENEVDLLVKKLSGESGTPPESSEPTPPLLRSAS